MRRVGWVAMVLAGAVANCGWAQGTPAAEPEGVAGANTTLQVESRLVQVPVLVTTTKGEIVFALRAPDFAVTDDGVPQVARLEEDTDSEPLALAVVVETGGAGAGHLKDYAGLQAVLDGFVGGVEHRVGVIGVDSSPTVLLPWTTEVDRVAATLNNLEPGDNGAALLDGVELAVRALQRQPPRYRRALLLLTETVDGGSQTTIDEALRMISDANIVVYSLAFSSTRAAVVHEASKLHQEAPGPAKGCFSKDGADAEYDGHYSKQVLDCISQLLPPVRLGTMAFLAARDGLRTNAAENMATLTGGAFVRFKDAKGVQRGLIGLTKQVPNRYVLSFRPTAPTEGLHALRVELPEKPGYVVRYRTEYWIAGAEATPEPK